ncbi:hypothetical protein T459_05852 [Capsicum annuum]|uniref:Uncharacterized protein n=1 Tax=Capsicum annuum TaxID=4072 RepID=A0A2G3A919_CAPAN|nr:hypothetical protein T459_05852 [Capsicum annuum]
MSIAEFILVSGDFMKKWVETPKCWKWRSFTKVTIPIPVRRNSSYDEFVASVMQSGNLDCAPSDVVISYLMHSREKVNPMIINSDVRVLTTAKLISTPTAVPAVDNDLNDYENGGDDPINMEDDSMHMEDFSSDSQDDEEDCGTASQPGHSSDGTNSVVVKHLSIRKS